MEIRSKIAEFMNSKLGPTFFYILICSRNCFDYLTRCLDSVHKQTYKNYQILFIDDASSYTKIQRKQIRNTLKGHIVHFNRKRAYAAKNIYVMLHKRNLKKDAVILNLDGDDWLADPHVLEYLDQIYNTYSCWYTYGNCKIWKSDQSTKLASSSEVRLNRKYSQKTIKSRSFRKDIFYPLHPRTWRLFLFLQLKKNCFLDENNNWLKFASDMMIYFPFLELYPNKLFVIRKVLYIYNCANKLSDNKENAFQLVRTELSIRQKTNFTQI